jgi:hypothetical protein
MTDVVTPAQAIANFTALYGQGAALQFLAANPGAVPQVSLPPDLYMDEVQDPFAPDNIYTGGGPVAGVLPAYATSPTLYTPIDTGGASMIDPTYMFPAGGVYPAF